jgi:hypothetical protein
VVTFDQFRSELRAFDGRRVVLKELRAELRKPLPKFRADVKRHAVAILPSSGGLGAWVAKATITLSARDRGRSAGIRLKGSRRSGKGKADLTRMDAGRTRHPSWGRKGAGQWHSQSVPPGFFTEPFDRQEWSELADRAVDRAFEQIRRG